MQPVTWIPPIELSQQEEQMVKGIRKAKLFIFLRKLRHELFDEAFRAANWQVCIAKQNEDNHPSPRRSWRLSLILEASMGVSDDEVIEATVMDRRGPLVLDCLDTEQAPFEPRDIGGLPKASH